MVGQGEGGAVGFSVGWGPQEGFLSSLEWRSRQRQGSLWSRGQVRPLLVSWPRLFLRSKGEESIHMKGGLMS